MKNIERQIGSGNKQTEEPTRRAVLKQINAYGTAAILGGAGVVGVIEGAKLLEPKEEGRVERPLSTQVDLNEIAGLHASALAQYYLGFSGRIPAETREVSFPANLREMAKQKIRNLKPGVSSECAEELYAFGMNQADEYDALWERGPEAVGVAQTIDTTQALPYFTDMVNGFSEAERQTLTALDWDAVARAYGFEDAWTVDMLKHLAGRVHGRSLAAYSMTEIMPYGGEAAHDNIRFADFMLKNAGKEFLNRIDAIFDPEISFGPFQFTKYAVDEGIARPHNPLALNQYLPEELRVPEHIKEFKTFEDHTRAGLLFGVQNVAVATRSLIEEGHGQESLNKIADMDGGTFASVLATHHYKPGPAKKALMEWANDAVAENTKKPYYAYCPEKVAHYGKRSLENFDAIERYFDEPTKAVLSQRVVDTF